MATIHGKGLLAVIGAVFAAASVNVGCLSPNSLTCSNGRVCPAGSGCDEVTGGDCFTPAELAACAAVADGGDCVFSGALGTCSSGGCRLAAPAWSATAAIGGGVAVWASDPDDAYARGYVSEGYATVITTLSHWDGTRWSPLEGGGTSVPDGAADSPLVGGGRVVLIRDGSNWSALPGNFWAISPKDAFGVGSFPATLAHWDGMQWTTLWTAPAGDYIPPLTIEDLPLNGVWASGPDDVFVVGLGIGHWDGAVMTTREEMSTGGTDSWFGVWGSGRNDVYAVGTGGAIAHWNGASWSRMTSGTGQTLFAVHGTGAGDVFAGGNEVLLRLHNGAWEPIFVPGFNSIRSLWVTPRRVFIGGDEGEIHLDRPR